MNRMIDYAKPEEVLLAFFEEMNRWDIECFPLIRSIPKTATREDTEAVYGQVLQRLNRIFEKYCTPKERKQGRQNWIGAASPPTYDPLTQLIVEVIYESPRRALVDTVDQKRGNSKFRYVLLKKGGRWLIDHKKWFTYDGKLEKDFL